MCVVVLYREWAARREGCRSPSSALRPRPLFGELGPARFHRVACLPAIGADWPTVSSDVPAIVEVGGPPASVSATLDLLPMLLPLWPLRFLGAELLAPGFLFPFPLLGFLFFFPPVAAASPSSVIGRSPSFPTWCRCTGGTTRVLSHFSIILFVLILIHSSRVISSAPWAFGFVP